ncbi:hypothetical protein GGX14DRAFT_399112 [Mycena pura]|uniref:Uncharacterized protein n=1 Tax=Mycena pura TaxID=153505 RepID=A0AAD6V5P1_9AGAR|nr:hypothetical protein GGX14DRAFT_399112 [Mycena pura]
MCMYTQEGNLFGLVILDEHPVPRERTLNFFRQPTNPVNTVPPLAFPVTYPRIPDVPPADLGFTVHPRANSVLSAWDGWPNGSFSCDLTVQNVLDTGNVHMHWVYSSWRGHQGQDTSDIGRKGKETRRKCPGPSGSHHL